MLAIVIDKEEYFNSCIAICHFLGMDYGDEIINKKIKDVKLRDLLYKFSFLQDSQKGGIIIKSWANLLPVELEGLLSAKIIDESRIVKTLEKRKVDKDIGIVTVKRNELSAVLTVLENESDNITEYETDAFRYYEGIVSRNGVSDISVVVTHVGQQRNIPCAIAVVKLLCQYNVQTLILIGIAGGVKKRVNLGDVICAERVYDYEHIRLECMRLFGIPLYFIKLPKRRPLTIEAGPLMKSITALIEKKDIIEYYEKMIKAKNITKIINGGDFDIHYGTIAAGEKLFADGSLKRLKRFDQRLYGGDQEDSGFAQAAQIDNREWCIFRGISDLGDPNKGKDWQYTAALRAATAAITYIKREWKKKPPV